LSLSGKIVLMTGATGRIGRPLLEAFAKADATVAITTRRFGETAARQQEFHQAGIAATILPCDLRYEEDVVRTVHRVAQQFGRIDVAINAAIVAGPRLNAVDYPIEPWRDVIATNVTGAFLLCREVLPWMIRRQSGSIINITDALAGSRGGKSAAYGISMQTVDSLTRQLAGDVKGTGVRVNAVDIGQLALATRGQTPKSDWTEPFLWLADDESAKVTGQRIQGKGFVRAT
jgi:NAD(P)-dependent dehydrogenase (short-subunit alcohol dehydrogenase family)